MRVRGQGSGLRFGFGFGFGSGVGLGFGLEEGVAQPEQTRAPLYHGVRLRAVPGDLLLTAVDLAGAATLRTHHHEHARVVDPALDGADRVRARARNRAGVGARVRAMVRARARAEP